MDTIQQIVDNLFEGIKSGDKTQLDAAYQEFLTLNSDDAMGELLVRLEDQMGDEDAESLLSRTRVPYPEKSKELIAALRDQDSSYFSFLATEKDLTNFIADLIQLNMALMSIPPR